MTTATSTEPAITYLHYDELQDYAIRDLARIKPGMEVLSIHRPTLEFDDWMLPVASPGVSQKTVESVSEIFWEKLHGVPLVEDSKPHTFVVFAGGAANALNCNYNFPADVGVEPYRYPDGEASIFNDTNFLVDLDELYRAGIEPITSTASDEYLAAVARYNSTVQAYIDSDPIYGGFI